MVVNLFEHKHLLDYEFSVVIVIEFVVLEKKINLKYFKIYKDHLY